ncbi:MAG: FAD-dependent oxidoreductase [Thermoanaerobaculales bacterium]
MARDAIGEAPTVQATYQVEMVDIAHLEREVLCRQGCPVRTDAGGYVHAIAEGRLEDAYRIARAPNPFASICGRICDAPCEQRCRRAAIDEAVSIRALKRFACDRFGIEAEAFDPALLPRLQGPPEARTHRVAVIGAGPAGLSCAHDLALMGYPVTVFEAAPRPGGMLTLGIPEYRLPRRLIEAEIEVILGLGVELRTNSRLGDDFGLAELLSGEFDAVFVGVGAQSSRPLEIPGREFEGVINALDFLVDRHLGRKVELGSRVVVIGGGNVALDVARSALRHRAPEDSMSAEELRAELTKAREALQTLTSRAGERPEEMKLAIDAARQALREGARAVEVFCLESLDEMPASHIEISEAGEEGVFIHTRLGPHRVLGKGGHVTGIELQKVDSVFDEAGRFNPVFSGAPPVTVEADTVILAIGQQPDLSWLRPEDNLQVTPRGTLLTDPDTLVTTNPRVFTGGDVAFGPRNVIRAVAEGRRAASSIAETLDGWCSKSDLAGYKSTVIPAQLVAEVYVARQRQKPPSLPRSQRIGAAEVEHVMAPLQASEQASRCLVCHVSPIFDSATCVACGGCVDVCPVSCLRLADVASIGGSASVAKVIAGRYGGTTPPAGAAASILKDETRCIRCGLCAVRCPVGAVTMEQVEAVAS